MNTNVDESKVMQIPIEDIVPNRAQPRVVFDDDSLQELADSIKEHGIIQPLVLRRNDDKYEIVAGERRYRAAKKAGLTEVPAIITTMSDTEAAEAAIVENIQRKDLTAIEEARSYKAILDKGDLSQADLAKKMGVSQSAISNKLRLLSLDEEVQQAVLESKISERHARSLLKVANKEDQKDLLHKVINERLTVKQLDAEIRKRVGDIPLVSSDVDVDKIKQETTDIEPLKTVSSNSVSGGTQPSSNNKFFNFLEESAVNMDVETPQENVVIPEPEPVEETPTPEPQVEEATVIEEIPEVENKPEFEPYPEINIPLKNSEEVKNYGSVLDSPIIEESLVEEAPTEEVEMLDDFEAPLVHNADSTVVDKIKAALVGKTFTLTENNVNNQQIINIIINN